MQSKQQLIFARKKCKQVTPCSYKQISVFDISKMCSHQRLKMNNERCLQPICISASLGPFSDNSKGALWYSATFIAWLSPCDKNSSHPPNRLPLKGGCFHTRWREMINIFQKSRCLDLCQGVSHPEHETMGIFPDPQIHQFASLGCLLWLESSLKCVESSCPQHEYEGLGERTCGGPSSIAENGRSWRPCVFIWRMPLLIQTLGFGASGGGLWQACNFFLW